MCAVAKGFPSGPTGNRLLNLVPAEELHSLLPRLQKLTLAVGQVLYEVRAPIEYVYFPLNCALSAVIVMQSGAAIEVATVGNEGLAGLPTFAALSTSPHRVFAQIGGETLRFEAAAFNQECARLPGLGRVMTNYQHAYMFQISQCVACNGLHVIVERCCRWLLMTHDRVEGDEIALTHEFLSYMLGVRRSSVTEVLQTLREKKLIRYSQGRIVVLDRPGLEALSCECYRCVLDEYQRLLGSGEKVR